MTLDFVIDSGASDVSVPADVVSTLMRAGTIKETDFIGKQTYILADGSKSQSTTFLIRSLRVGDTVLENVNGSVASSRGSLLLGQSFLKRFKSWSIDNTKQELLLELVQAAPRVQMSAPVAASPQTQPSMPSCWDVKAIARPIIQANPGISNETLGLAVEKMQVAMGCRPAPQKTECSWIGATWTCRSQ
jgi:hypothetical protein